MEERKATVTFEEARLREVALNSLLIKNGQKVRVKAVQVHKNNNVRVGIEVRLEDCPVGMTYYPTSSEMRQSDADFLETLIGVMREEKRDVRAIACEPTREQFAESLMPEVMSVENVEWLAEAGRPCKPVLDMVMTLRCLWGEGSLADSEKLASCLVTERLLDHYGIDVDEAFSIAMRNAENAAEMMPIRSVVEELLGAELPENDDWPKMLVVSNRYRSNGAPLMLSRKVQSELLDIFGRGSVAVLPSSVHEFIAVGADFMAVDQLKAMVTEINRTQVAPEDRLTDEVYLITGTPESPVFGMYTGLGLPGQTFLVASC